jgi:hypothetical protein
MLKHFFNSIERHLHIVLTVNSVIQKSGDLKNETKNVRMFL